MAARIKKFHTDEIRAKIQATQLIKRLTEHALGTVDLKPEQVRSIDILLKKCVPDLSAVQISGDQDNPVKTVTEITLKPLEG
jgi:hypothetical protein